MYFNGSWRRRRRVSCIRALMENIFALQKLDAVFHKTAKKQYERGLLFSTLVTLTSQVVCRISEKVRTRVSQPAASRSRVSAHRCLRQTAGGRVGDIASFGATLGTRNERIDWLPAFMQAAVAGLPRADLGWKPSGARRNIASKCCGARRPGALPGQGLVLLDPQRMVIDDVVPCEDGHAQERSLLDQVLAALKPRDLADRRPQFLHAAVLVWHGGSHSSLYHAAAWPDALEIAGKTALCWRCRDGTCTKSWSNLRDPETGRTTQVRRIILETLVADPRRRQRNLPVDQLAGKVEPPRRWPRCIANGGHSSKLSTS